MGKILLLEPEKENVRRLVFLLHLAGYKCTVAHTPDEVLNWLRSETYLNAQFDLLLLGSGPDSQSLEQLFAGLKELPSLPVICLQRQPQIDRQLLPEGVISCPSEDLIWTLDQQLQPTANNQEMRGT